MPTFDLIVKVDGDDDTIPYEQRRVRVQELEVSSYRREGEEYGQSVLHEDMWRIIRVTDMPEGVPDMLIAGDVLGPEDLGKDFQPRRKLYYLIFEVKPRDTNRPFPWDIEVTFNDLIYIQKEPEPRDLSGYPVEAPV